MKFLILCLTGMTLVSNVYASALDESGQSILPFLEKGNYAEANIFVIDPKISGKVRDKPQLVDNSQDLSTGDMAQSFQYYNAALKLQLNERFAFGLIYDQPFGADVLYPVKQNNSYSETKNLKEGTSVNVDSQNISMILGVKPYQNVQFYLGPVYQTIKGDVALRGNAYTTFFNGYDANFKEDSAIGWLAGMSYQIPDIELKLAVTYRSKIKHEMNVEESIYDQPINVTSFEKTKITTPQSINLDFQTGVNQSTLAFINLRWVNWKKFNIRPTQFGAITQAITSELTGGTYDQGFDLDSHQKDQLYAAIGLGHQISEKLSIGSEVSWDSGTGNPASSLNPTKGAWGLGLGLQYNPAPNYFIATGIKYFWLGDAVAQDGTYHLPIDNIKQNAEQADFKNNSSIAYGLKFGYRF
ncbi:OmpP1/FadL family transporter [Acinetobacter venetianus]|uniref:OmpP1/FadL family transporter n=1 Tax=Acinetobacter venetianus TaxID=52133 RepID=UPI00077886F8|nr:outer membrane protein transport protein [Acinetobacter venetianus]KXZ64822.1 Outer membrane protein transport protein (OMPP1/FadL/TodX) [Acinetobacter venetianus]